MGIGQQIFSNFGGQVASQGMGAGMASPNPMRGNGILPPKIPNFVGPNPNDPFAHLRNLGTAELADHVQGLADGDEKTYGLNELKTRLANLKAAGGDPQRQSVAQNVELSSPAGNAVTQIATPSAPDELGADRSLLNSIGFKDPLESKGGKVSNLLDAIFSGVGGVVSHLGGDYASENEINQGRATRVAQNESDKSQLMSGLLALLTKDKSNEQKNFDLYQKDPTAYGKFKQAGLPANAQTFLMKLLGMS